MDTYHLLYGLASAPITHYSLTAANPAATIYDLPASSSCATAPHLPLKYSQHLLIGHRSATAHLSLPPKIPSEGAGTRWRAGGQGAANCHAAIQPSHPIQDSSILLGSRDWGDSQFWIGQSTRSRGEPPPSTPRGTAPRRWRIPRPLCLHLISLVRLASTAAGPPLPRRIGQCPPTSPSSGCAAGRARKPETDQRRALLRISS